MKKVVSLLLVMAIACSFCVTALAATPAGENAGVIDSTASVGTDYVGDTTTGTDTNYDPAKKSESQTLETGKLGTQDAVDVYVSKSATYTVIIPKTIILSGETGEGAYDVSVKGNIEGMKKIMVVPYNEAGTAALEQDATKDGEKLILKQAGKTDIKATVTLDKMEYTWRDLEAVIGDYEDPTDDGELIGHGTITAHDLTAGSWAGVFTMYISYVDNPAGA